MVAFGSTQKTNKDDVMKNFEWPKIQSQMAMLSNMLNYNYYAHKHRYKVQFK
jgi:hypothetical protein